MSAVPKKTDHSHGSYVTWNDEHLIAHVKAEHTGLDEQPWLANKSNMTLLVAEHQKAHHRDPISFEGLT